MKGNWFMFVAAAVMGLSLGLVGCGGGDSEEPGDSATGLTGEIIIDGSSTVYPISAAVAGEFQKKNKGVKVSVGKSGTGGGFKKFAAGETHISDASRPIKGKEATALKEKNIEYIEVPVAYDGLTIAVNKSNDFAKELTVDQLRKIFLAPGAKTWNEIDPSYPETEIALFAPGEASGTYDYFMEVVGGKKDKATGKHKYGEFREGVVKSEEDNILVNGIAGSVGGIGFFGASYYFDNKDKLNSVAIVNSDGTAVKPSPESIESGEYNPFSRPLFIYVKKSAMNRPEVKAFVDFYLSNAASIASEVKYVSLPQSIYDVAKRKVKNLETGSVYLDENMEKVSGSVTGLYK